MYHQFGYFYGKGNKMLHCYTHHESSGMIYFAFRRENV